MELQAYNFYLDKLKNLAYPPQDHWDIFDQDYYKKISDFNTMAQFRTNGISNMLETALPSQDRAALIRSEKTYSPDYNDDEIRELKKRFLELKKMLGVRIDQVPFNLPIGSPRSFIYNDEGVEYDLNFDDLYHVYAAWQIKRYSELLFKNKEINKIVEIGAGYGSLPHKLKTLLPKTQYVIVDLPEVLLIQHYYLSKSQPGCKIVNLINSEAPSSLDIDDIDCDFLLIPSAIFQDLNIKFDIIINNRSFGEMPRHTLTQYIEWAQANLNLNGFLYTVNRYVFTKSADKNKIRNYPFDNKWRPIVSQPQWLQTHLHEFLLQRCDETPIIPLSFLLQSFPVSTPPPGPIMQKIQSQSEWIKNQNLSEEELIGET